MYVGNDPVNFVDPTGKFANFVVGAVIGAGANYLAQGLIKGFDNVDGGEVLIAAIAGGATSGLSAGATFGASLSYGAAGSVGQYVATQTYYDKEVTTDGLIGTAVLGAAGGAIGYVGAPTRRGLEFVERSVVSGAVNRSVAVSLNRARSGTVSTQNFIVQWFSALLGNAPTE